MHFTSYHSIRKNSGFRRGFTLVELIISMALITVAIVVFVQVSGPFRDRLALISKRVETKMALMRLAIYLHDLKSISDSVSISDDSSAIIFEKNGIDLARCGPNQFASMIECSFHSHAGMPVPIFSMSDNGFNELEWSTSSLSVNGIVRHALIIGGPQSVLSAMPIRTSVDFGILPGVHAN